MPYEFDEIDYMAEEGDMSDFEDDVDGEENGWGDRSLDDYDMRLVEGPVGTNQDLRSFQMILEYIKALPIRISICFVISVGEDSLRRSGLRYTIIRPGPLTKAFHQGESYEAAVWQIPELYGQSNSPQLECIASLDAHNSKIKGVLWWPSGRHDKLISINEQNIFLWSLDSAKKSAQVQSQESAGMLHHLSGGAWDPHDMNVVSSTSESSIQFWDLRTMKKTNSIEYSHVRNIDYDHKKKHMLITAADESDIHIWDLRMMKSPVNRLTWTFPLKMEGEIGVEIQRRKRCWSLLYI